MNVKQHFESKNLWAEQEISDHAPALILGFGNENGEAGWVMATKVKADITRFVPINVFSSKSEGDDEVVPFVIVGTGHVGDLEDLVEYAKDFSQDSVNAYGGVAGLNAEKFKTELSRALRSRYNDVRHKAFGVELAVLSLIVGSKYLCRFKYNGEHHPCEYFAVLGGYEHHAETGGSVRKAILGDLNEFYKEKIPSKEDAIKKVNEMLEKFAKDKGFTIVADLAFDVALAPAS